MQMFGASFLHQRAISALAETAPDHAKVSLNDMIQKAINANIPWLKILQAVATAAAGGFTPASIAAAIALLFGIAATAQP